jgi:hypothetical protein
MVLTVDGTKLTKHSSKESGVNGFDLKYSEVGFELKE